MTEEKNKKKGGVAGKVATLFYIRPQTKRWLKKLAKKRETSMSKMLEEILRDVRKIG